MSLNPTIQVKRGAKSTMPILHQGEFGFVTDTNAEELYIGNGSQNIQIARQDYVEANMTSNKPGIVVGIAEPEPYSDGTHPVWLDTNGDDSAEFATQTDLELYTKKSDLDPISFNGVVNTTGSSDIAEGARTGNVVEVTLILTSDESGETTGAAQMPYKPVRQVRSSLISFDGQLCRIILRTTGVLDIYPVISGKATFYGQIIYITNDEVLT